MTHIINTHAIILFLQGKSYRVEKSDKRYPKILKAFDLPEDEQEEVVLSILQPEELNVGERLKGQEGFEVVGEDVFYKNQKLPNALSTKIKSLLREELPVKHFELFWGNLSLNPSSSSVEELMEFLEYKELPITDDGCFIAYKGVQDDYWSVSGNTETTVLKGQVDSTGRILNEVGAEIEVLRRNVDDNRNQHCSYGLHVGSHSYARGFGSKTMVVKVNPRDVVSVPNDYNCQKCRVSAYKVLSEYVYEYESPVLSSEGEDNVVSNGGVERSAFVERIEGYLDRKYDEGKEFVSIRQIQNSFSPEYPSRQRVLDALQELGLCWDENDDGVWIDDGFGWDDSYVDQNWNNDV